MDSIHKARLAQSVEHQTLNRRIVGSSPTVDKEFFILYFHTLLPASRTTVHV